MLRTEDRTPPGSAGYSTPVSQGPVHPPVLRKRLASSLLAGAAEDAGVSLSSVSWTLEVIPFVQLTCGCPVTAFSSRRPQGAPWPWPGSAGP